MKFGMLHFFEQPAGDKTEHRIVKEQLESVPVAEELGFDYLWAPEHHSTEYGWSSSPMLQLAAAAAITKRIRLGSAVVVLPFNDPVRLAEEGAMLDLLSDGRFDLGIGRGFQPVEFNAFQVYQPNSRLRFGEAVEIIRQAWGRGEVEFSGTQFNIARRQVRPRPLQQPHPPIWMAAISDESFTMAGRYGFNLLCSMIYGFKSERARQLLSEYRRAIKEYRQHPGQPEIGALCMVYCAESTEQARREFGGPVLWYYRTIADYIAPPAGQRPVESYEAYLGSRLAAQTVKWDELLRTGAVICGTPELCTQRIQELQREYGITQILCWTRFSGLDNAKVTRSMELLSRHVFAHFRPQAAHETAAGNNP